MLVWRLKRKGKEEEQGSSKPESTSSKERREVHIIPGRSERPERARNQKRSTRKRKRKRRRKRTWVANRKDP
jgi:hypothetical protein